MGLAIEAQPVPLYLDEDGVARVNGTRVTLDLIIEAFQHSVSAEEIALRYTTLNLADVYAVITYYLQNKQEVEAYLARRQKEKDAIRRENEKKFPPGGIRERLLARRTSSEEGLGR
jgi:uncharacterized protein (DUF433 family)